MEKILPLKERIRKFLFEKAGDTGYVVIPRGLEKPPPGRQTPGAVRRRDFICEAFL